MALLLSAIFAGAQTEPLIWTDKPDYDPLETVYISGLRFNPDSNVDIYIARPDGQEEIVPATSDSEGNFADAEYELTTERAFEGDYYVCGFDGVNYGCTSFTDCGGCDFTANLVCENVNGEYKFTATANSTCIGKLWIIVKDLSSNVKCQYQKMTYSNTVSCWWTEQSCSFTGKVKLYKYKFSFCGWPWEQINGEKDVSADCCTTTTTSSTTTTIPTTTTTQPTTTTTVPTTTTTEKPQNGDIPEFTTEGLTTIGIIAAVALVAIYLLKKK